MRAGPQIVDVHRAHHEGKAGRLHLRLFEQRMLLGAHQAQMVGAAALHEAQIVGVIDDAGKIRVLVIDADLHVMAAVADLAVELGQIQIHLPPSIALKAIVLRKSACRASLRGVYATAGAAPPSVTSTISGGTPMRNGMMLQPRPPETTTSHFVRMWP